MAIDRFELGEVTLVYQDSGGAGRPFVLVHGYTGNRHDFADHYDDLAALGRTISYDHRGHGDSTNTADAASYSFARLCDDLDSFLDHLGAAEIDLLGHSMGGMVALRYVLARPQRVASLILMDTSARMPDGFQKAVFEMGAAVARAEGMATLARTAREIAEKDPNRPEASRAFQRRIGDDAYWKRHFDRMTAMDAEAFYAFGVELADQEPVSERLGEIACPTTILVGDQDLPFLRPAEELEIGIPGARRVVLEGAAHSPQLETPEAWFAAVRDHLERVR